MGWMKDNAAAGARADLEYDLAAGPKFPTFSWMQRNAEEGARADLEYDLAAPGFEALFR